MNKWGLIILFILVFAYSAESAVISGNIYEDFDGDSLLSNETKGNITISVFNINTLNEKTFYFNNYYELNLEKGNYIITAISGDNEVITYPELGFYYIISNNEDLNGKDFGKFALGKIYGYVYDLNNNPLQNVYVNLSNNLTYLTNSKGYYEFNSLEHGNYEIKVQDKSINNILIDSGVSLNYNFNVDYKPRIITEDKETIIEEFLSMFE